MLQQYVKDVADNRVPLLKMVEKHEDFVRHFLGVFGLGITNAGVMEEEKVLSQWDVYDAQHLGPLAQFTITLMDIYTYLITQCQEAA